MFYLGLCEIGMAFEVDEMIILSITLSTFGHSVTISDRDVIQQTAIPTTAYFFSPAFL